MSCRLSMCRTWPAPKLSLPKQPPRPPPAILFGGEIGIGGNCPSASIGGDACGIGEMITFGHPPRMRTTKIRYPCRSQTRIIGLSLGVAQRMPLILRKRWRTLDQRTPDNQRGRGQKSFHTRAFKSFLLVRSINSILSELQLSVDSARSLGTWSPCYTSTGDVTCSKLCPVDQSALLAGMTSVRRLIFGRRSARPRSDQYPISRWHVILK